MSLQHMTKYQDRGRKPTESKFNEIFNQFRSLKMCRWNALEKSFKKIAD